MSEDDVKPGDIIGNLSPENIIQNLEYRLHNSEYMREELEFRIKQLDNHLRMATSENSALNSRIYELMIKNRFHHCDHCKPVICCEGKIFCPCNGMPTKFETTEHCGDRCYNKAMIERNKAMLERNKFKASNERLKDFVACFGGVEPEELRPVESEKRDLPDELEHKFIGRLGRNCVRFLRYLRILNK